MLAIIPARGGSKGILQKNIKLLSGKPLIAWSIETAKKAKCIDRLVVSTDSDAIAKIAIQYGAEVPFLRPPELATDNSPGIEPALHAVEHLPGFDWLLLLQPTSPLRTAMDIDSIYEFCNNKNASSAVSICEVKKHPYWMYKKDNSSYIQPFFNKHKEINRRQDLPKAYSLNGALYLIKVDQLIKNKSFINQETLGYLMTPERSTDIDTMEDWNWAEYLIKQKK